jgi:hypothetical protein
VEMLTTKGPVRIAEIWFDDDLRTAGADIVRFRNRSTPVEEGRCLEWHTLIVDLTQEAAVIETEIKSDTRYAIRRAAAKDELTYNYHDQPGDDAMESFLGFYNEFARATGLPAVKLAHLGLMRDTRKLILTNVKTADGEDLVWHSYLCGSNQVRLLHSASLFRTVDNSKYRQRVGRANRYHHWRDFLKLKEAGFRTYDFGGWYAGSDDPDKVRINRFKEEFGGTVVPTYYGEVALTMLGKAALKLKRAWDKGVSHG